MDGVRDLVDLDPGVPGLGLMDLVRALMDPVALMDRAQVLMDPDLGSVGLALILMGLDLVLVGQVQILMDPVLDLVDQALILMDLPTMDQVDLDQESKEKVTKVRAVVLTWALT